MKLPIWEMWEKRRKSKFNHAVTGFVIGLLMSINIGILIAIPLLYDVTIAFIGTALAGIALIALGILFILISSFGYKDLKSVIGNTIFRRGVLMGFYAGALFWIIALFKTYTAPL